MCELWPQSYGKHASLYNSIIILHNNYDMIFYNTGANYFFLLICGTIASFNNLVSWGAGSFLSEVWFPVTERATATAIAMAVAPGVGQL